MVMYQAVQVHGRRSYQEDRYLAVPNFYMGYSLFAVFDGHGGDWAAEFCKENMASFLLAKLREFGGFNMRTALIDTFHTLSEAMPRDKSYLCGTTCTLVLKHERHMWVANCGDSRVILGKRSAYAVMSRDHKPGDVDEAARIHASGGFVSSASGIPRVLGELAVSRSLGDARYHPYVIATPEITYSSFSSDTLYVLLATDGLWDEMGNGEVAGHVAGHIAEPNLVNALNNLTSELAKKGGPEDNVTVLIVRT